MLNIKDFWMPGLVIFPAKRQDGKGHAWCATPWNAFHPSWYQGTGRCSVNIGQALSQQSKSTCSESDISSTPNLSLQWDGGTLRGLMSCSRVSLMAVQSQAGTLAPALEDLILHSIQVFVVHWINSFQLHAAFNSTTENLQKPQVGSN